MASIIETNSPYSSSSSGKLKPQTPSNEASSKISI